jgi:hypothetical protein
MHGTCKKWAALVALLMACAVVVGCKEDVHPASGGAVIVDVATDSSAPAETWLGPDPGPTSKAALPPRRQAALPPIVPPIVDL